MLGFLCTGLLTLISYFNAILIVFYWYFTILPTINKEIIVMMMMMMMMMIMIMIIIIIIIIIIICKARVAWDVGNEGTRGM